MSDSNQRESFFVDGSGTSPDFDRSYALSGKIMLSAIIILFFVVVFMVCLHLYARWYLLRHRRRTNAVGDTRRHRRRGNNLVFHMAAGGGGELHRRGLDAAVIASLPTFVFGSSEKEEAPIECAVCLSEFEAGEAGRRLPKCGHCFHAACIDMWFHSHATCPLCRSPVESISEVHSDLVSSDPEVRIDVAEPDAAVVERGGAPSPRRAETCADCAAEASSAAEMRRSKNLASVSIEVPARSGEAGFGSPATPSFRSPMSRMLSFTRILRRNGVVSPSGNGTNSVNESDIETQ